MKRASDDRPRVQDAPPWVAYRIHAAFALEPVLGNDLALAVIRLAECFPNPVSLRDRADRIGRSCLANVRGVVARDLANALAATDDEWNRVTAADPLMPAYTVAAVALAALRDYRAQFDAPVLVSFGPKGRGRRR